MIGNFVTSTKAYTSQLACFALLTVYLGRLRGVLSEAEAREHLAHLRAIPEKMEWCLAHIGEIERLANEARYAHASHAMYMGRSYNFPSALEGALKLKEISYIHVEGYAAGEMKHGPIALVTGELPVLCVAVKGSTYEKTLSNIQEIQAREGIVMVIATEGDEAIADYCHDLIHVPACFEPYSPMIVAIPLQLFAYYVALNKGCDVDQPRNLAKSVTVE